MMNIAAVIARAEEVLKAQTPFTDPREVEYAQAVVELSKECHKIRDYLLDQPWHKRVRIIPDYMPPFPRPDTQPIVLIEYDDGTEYKPRLRYSIGPKQGFFWDIYGDDFRNEALALIAISQAPAPVNVGPIRVSIPIGSALSPAPKEGECQNI